MPVRKLIFLLRAEGTINRYYLKRERKKHCSQKLQLERPDSSLVHTVRVWDP